MSLNRILTIYSAKDQLNRLGEDFAIIHNPEYIFPPFEIIPLAPKISSLRNYISAIVSDMDGTTTTTEELCLYSLEYMVRAMSGRLTLGDWIGLDKTIDYPHIIGNSTTKHVEFLVNRYSNFFDERFIAKVYIKATVWQLIYGKDKVRIEEILSNLKLLKLESLISDINFISLKNSESLANFDTSVELIKLMQTYSPVFEKTNYTVLVKMAIDIYYYKYHEILTRIKNGESKKIALELFNDEHKNLIEPMPGIAIFLALIKGWLLNNTDEFIPILLNDYYHKAGSQFLYEDIESLKNNLKQIALKFHENPAKISIVTSSIFYEADIVLTEVFNVIKEQIKSYNINLELKNDLIHKFNEYNTVYDSIVTASDSNEIRLKPHRDLYSIALHNLHIEKNDFENVIGLEDSESGTFAIRAAGIGCCVAVPFAQTNLHNFDAASVIAKGGLPELILKNNLFLL